MRKNAYLEMYNVEDTHWWYVGLHDLVLSLAKKLFPYRTLKILDAGCGTGGLLSVLSKSGYEVEGIDYSKDALELCKKRGIQNVQRADLNEWKPSQNSYDLIVSMDVLYHKWIRNEIQILRSLANGLQENGLMMLNYPAFPILHRKHDEIVMARERYTKNILKARLKKAGLKPIIISYRVPHAFFFLLTLSFLETLQTNSSDTQSDVAEIPPKFVNKILIKINRIENYFITRGFSIPFGSSLFVVAKKDF